MTAYCRRVVKTVKCQHCFGTGRLPDQRAVGSGLRDLRVEAGISLREMADLLQFTASYVSDLELGKRSWKKGLVDAFTEICKTHNKNK